MRCVHVVHLGVMYLSVTSVSFLPYLVVGIVRCGCSDFSRACNFSESRDCNVPNTVVDWGTQGGSLAAK